MFYDEAEINDILICPQCDTRYEEAKILPCGKAVCSYCIQKLNKEFQCSFCSKTHVASNEGYPTCDIISRLLSIKSNEIFRGDKVHSLKTNLNDIQKAINELSYSIDHGVDCIKEHCLNLRVDVQLATESIIKEVNEKSEQILLQINQYETERIKDFEETRTNEKKAGFIEMVEELKQFHSEWDDYIKEFMISESEVIKANRLALDLKSKSMREKAKLQNFNFNGHYLKYIKNEQNLEKNILGSLFSTKPVGNFNQLNIKDLFPDYRSDFKMELIKQNYLIGYCNTRNSISLNIIDHNKRVLNTYQITELTYGNPDIDHQNAFSFKIINNQKIIVFINYYDHNQPSKLILFDERFTREFEIKANAHYIKLAANSSNIYCINIENNLDKGKLDIYDLNLTLISSIGQSIDPINPFYIPNDLIQLENKNGKYLWLNPIGLSIVCEQTGIILKTIQIKSEKILIDSNDHLLLISDKDKNVSFFNLNGENLYDWDLKNVQNISSALIDLNDQISFYDAENFNLLYGETKF